MATWDEILAAQSNLLPDVQKEVEAQRKTAVDALDTQKKYQMGVLQKQLEDANQQAYITREMNRRDLPSYLAQQGLTGGITETAANDLLRSYRNSVNSANNQLMQSTNELENTYATNLADVNTTYGEMLTNALAQRRAEELQRAVLAAQYSGVTAADTSSGSSGGGGGIIADNSPNYGGAGAQGYQGSYVAPNAYKKTATEKARSSWYNPSTYKTPAVSGKYF